MTLAKKQGIQTEESKDTKRTDVLQSVSRETLTDVVGQKPQKKAAKQKTDSKKPNKPTPRIKKEKVEEEKLKTARKKTVSTLFVDKNKKKRASKKATIESFDEFAHKTQQQIQKSSCKKLYKDFRKGGLSVVESAYNALYLYCNERYTAEKDELEAKEKYKNIPAHPLEWHKYTADVTKKHNKWSLAVTALEFLPKIKRKLYLGDEYVRYTMRRVKSFGQNFETSHTAIKLLGRVAAKTGMWVVIAASAAFCLMSVHYKVAGNTPGMELYINGEYKGVCDSISAAEIAKTTFEVTETRLLGATYELDCDIEYKPRVAKKSDVMNHAQLMNVFSEVASENVMAGFGLYVDGMLVCVSPYKIWLDASIQESLEIRKLDMLYSGVELDEVSYYNNLTVNSGIYPKNLFKELAEIREMFHLEPMTEEEFEKLQGASTTIRGDSGKITINNAQTGLETQNADNPSVDLQVVVEKTLEKKVETDYPTAFVEDDKLVEGKKVVDTVGKKGVDIVTYAVKFFDGKEISRTEISRTTDKAPVSEIVRVGTRPMTEEEKRTKSTGTYIWPAQGTFTSDYGWRILGSRREFHKGVDIAGPYGTDIVAADGGEVVYAQGDYSGYGLNIRILHDDGTITKYAHFSKLLVKEGQRVAQGEIIGKMGNTGNVTGVHVHFEIIKDGKTQAPLEYLE